MIGLPSDVTNVSKGQRWALSRSGLPCNTRVPTFPASDEGAWCIRACLSVQRLSKSLAANAIDARRRVAAVFVLFLTTSAIPTRPLICAEAADQEIGNLLEEFSIRVDGSSLMVPVKLQHKEFLFVVDTGCEALLIDKSLRGFLAEPNVVTSVPGTNLVLEGFRSLDASVGNLSLRPAGAVVCTDLSVLRNTDGEDVYGIIGMPFLRSYVMRLDPDNRKLFFLTSAREGDGRRLVLKDPNGPPEVSAVLAGHRRINLLLDTGCAGHGSVTLPDGIFRELEHAGHIKRVGLGTSSGLTAHAISTFGKLQSIRLGNTSESDVICSSHDDDACLLGLNFLVRHIVTFDFPNGVVYIRKAEVAPRFADGDLGGLNIERQGAEIVVESVDVRGPAESAGLRAGDRLTDVDGRDCSRLGLNGVIRAFCEYGAKVRVGILRESESLATSVTLPDRQPREPSKSAVRRDGASKREGSEWHQIKRKFSEGPR